MNTAAAIAFITVMLTGMTALAALVWRDRRRTTPPPEPEFCGNCNLDCDDCICLRPASVYDETVTALGDPGRIDIQPPAFLW